MRVWVFASHFDACSCFIPRIKCFSVLLLWPSIIRHNTHSHSHTQLLTNRPSHFINDNSIEWKTISRHKLCIDKSIIALNCRLLHYFFIRFHSVSHALDLLKQEKYLRKKSWQFGHILNEALELLLLFCNFLSTAVGSSQRNERDLTAVIDNVKRNQRTTHTHPHGHAHSQAIDAVNKLKSLHFYLFTVSPISTSCSLRLLLFSFRDVCAHIRIHYRILHLWWCQEDVLFALVSPFFLLPVAEMTIGNALMLTSL